MRTVRARPELHPARALRVGHGLEHADGTAAPMVVAARRPVLRGRRRVGVLDRAVVEVVSIHREPAFEEERLTKRAQPRHYALKLDYGKSTERIVLFATQAERLAAAKAAL